MFAVMQRVARVRRRQLIPVQCIGPEEDGDVVEQYDGGTGEYINLPPTIQRRDQFDAGGPQRACNGRPANLGYTPAKMYIDRQAKNTLLTETD